MTPNELLELAKKQITAQSEVDRRAHHTQLAAWYRGEGHWYADQLVLRAFTDPANQLVRRRFVNLACSAGVIRRAATELAIVYSSPARRTLSNGDEQFRRLLEALAFDDLMLEASRLLAVHHALWFEAREVDGDPRLDAYVPDDFAVLSPFGDPRRVTAIAVRIPTEPQASARVPHWRIMSREHVLIVDDRFLLVRADEHPTPGQLPGVLALASPPSVRGRVLDDRPSSELLAAEEATALQSILALKESVSFTRQAYLSGDTSAVAVGQTSDTLSEVALGDGVSVTAVDRGVDLTVFQRVADHVQDVAFAGIGIAPAQRRRDAVTSGFDLQLRRLPLLERRKQMLAVWRRIEHALVDHMGRVFQFDPSGFAIDFAEIEQPLSELESLQAFEQARRLGLRTTADELQRRNPDLTYADAIDLIAENVEEESARIALMQDLARQNANTSTAVGDSTNGNRDAGPVNSDEKASIQ